MFGKKEDLDVRSKPLFYFKGEFDSIVLLNEEESRHGALSLRLKEGDAIILTNGNGTFAEGVCAKLHPKAIQVNVLKTESRPVASIYRRLCVAPPKTSERLDWMIEKSVEIGVNEILLLETQNSERNKINLERLNKIAVATIKQSKQAYLPQISGIIKWKHFLEQDIKGSNFIAHVSCSSGASFLRESINNQDTAISILIGPEGDFTMAEVEGAVKKGFKEVSLGENVLRTETAAIYALTIFNAFM